MPRKLKEDAHKSQLQPASLRIVPVVARRKFTKSESNQSMFQTTWLNSVGQFTTLWVSDVPPSHTLLIQEFVMIARKFFAIVALIGFVGFATAQAPKKDDKTTEKPADKKDDKKEKGQLPQYWKQLGLTDKQVQEVYKIQNKYSDEIDGLEAKIKELKEKSKKEANGVLTKEQKERLETIIKEKAGTDKK
jgi:Spy/CpxP family protein refolding chaperone